MGLGMDTTTLGVSVAALVAVVLGGLQYLLGRDLDRVRDELAASQAHIAILDKRLSEIQTKTHFKTLPTSEVRTWPIPRT